MSIETTTGMSPPPIEATRCTPPSASAISVSRISAISDGEMTNQTVSAANRTSEPRLRKFLPGSTSGLEENFAASLPQATIEPVKVTAPMNTPMATSARWIPIRSGSMPPPPAASTSR